MIDYANRVALVTGAASGIGRTLALALAARGAHVVCADIDADGAAKTAADIGRTAIHVECDLIEHEAAAQLVTGAWGWQERLDLICSNAGIGLGRRLIKQELDERANRLMEINLFSNLRVAQAYARQMMEAGQSGRLMFTGSENSLSVPAAVKGTGQGLYGVTKHGVLIMAEWMRDEFESGNVPVTLHVLMPGAVYTALVASAIPSPELAPPELNLIMPERCADLALKGLDLGLFYIPTHAHIAEDMKPRFESVLGALKALGLS